MSNIIEAKTLKGFRDFLPNEMYIRQKVIQTCRETFESYGYEPLETPVLEYEEILLGKYGEEAEHLLYRFQDHGKRKVAMKYDLTVPACRVLAQYQNEISLPFKRYQIQPVWRAENTQKGRFREFYQCDADTFGTKSLLAEVEYMNMAISLFSKLNFKDAIININNRKLIEGMIYHIGADEKDFYTICIAIDKLDKIGANGIEKELNEKNIGNNIIKNLLSLLEKRSDENVLDCFENILSNSARAKEGLDELRFIKDNVNCQDSLVFDPAIIRGLSYYTGPVWECIIPNANIGSVGGGGRYDNLVGTYLGKPVPASGGSFGIERIMEVMKVSLDQKNLSNISYCIVIFPEYVKMAIKVAEHIRSQGKSVLLYPDENARLQKQFKYINKKNIKYAVLVGEDEIKRNLYIIRNMETGNQEEVEFEY